MLTAPPDAGAFTNDIVTEALANLEELGVDTTGELLQPTEVTLERRRSLASPVSAGGPPRAARPAPRHRSVRRQSATTYHPDRWRPCCS